MLCKILKDAAIREKHSFNNNRIKWCKKSNIQLNIADRKRVLDNGVSAQGDLTKKRYLVLKKENDVRK